MVDEVKLTDDQMKSLVDMMAERLVGLPTKEGGANNAEDESGQGNGQNMQTPQQGQQGQQEQIQITPEVLAKAVAEQMQAISAKDGEKVFDTLWREKYQNAVSQVPGLGEFIKGEDDYGVVREERLNGLGSYEEKIAALDKLKNSFAEASAGTAGRRPVVNKQAQKKAEEAEDRYSELDKKLKDGTYNSVSEMTSDFFNAMSAELEGLT